MIAGSSNSSSKDPFDFSTVTAIQASVFLDLANNRMNFQTPGLFRTDAIHEDLKEPFIKGVFERIVACGHNYAAADESVTAFEKSFFDTKNVKKLLKLSKRSPKPDFSLMSSHCWAYFAKKLLIKRPFVTWGRFESLVSSDIYINQLHELLSTFKRPLEARSKLLSQSDSDEERKRAKLPNFDDLVANETFNNIYLSMSASCIMNDDIYPVKIFHQFVYTLKKALTAQIENIKLQNEANGMLLGGVFFHFMRFSGVFNAVLPLINTAEATQLHITKHIGACLITHGIFDEPFDSNISAYLEHSYDPRLYELAYAKRLELSQQLSPLLLLSNSLPHSSAPPSTSAGPKVLISLYNTLKGNNRRGSLPPSLEPIEPIEPIRTQIKTKPPTTPRPIDELAALSLNLEALTLTDTDDFQPLSITRRSLLEVPIPVPIKPPKPSSNVIPRSDSSSADSLTSSPEHRPASCPEEVHRIPPLPTRLAKRKPT